MSERRTRGGRHDTGNIDRRDRLVIGAMGAPTWSDTVAGFTVFKQHNDLKEFGDICHGMYLRP
jgi:hypothetical protein